MNAKVKIPAELENILGVCNPSPLPITAALLVEHLHKTYSSRLAKLQKRRKDVIGVVIAEVMTIADRYPGAVQLSCPVYVGSVCTAFGETLLRNLSTQYPKSIHSGLQFLASLYGDKMEPLFLCWRLSSERQNSSVDYGSAYNAWADSYFGVRNDLEDGEVANNLPRNFGHEYQSSNTALIRKARKGTEVLRKDDNGKWVATSKFQTTSSMTIDLTSLKAARAFLAVIDEEAALAQEIADDIKLLLGQAAKVKDARGLLKKMPDLLERPDILSLLKIDASPLDDRLNNINHALSGAGLLGLPLEKAQ